MNAPRPLLAAALLIAAVATACSAAPATPTSGSSAATVSVVLSNDGCAPNPATVPAGSVTFNVSNQGGDKVSELELLLNARTVGERENLTPGLTGSFTVTLQPGSYALECPGATKDESDFTVTP
jgi:iron uptake system component EfeO